GRAAVGHRLLRRLERDEGGQEPLGRGPLVRRRLFQPRLEARPDLHRRPGAQARLRPPRRDRGRRPPHRHRRSQGGVRLVARRPRLPPEVRLRPRPRRRRQQAGRHLRQGRREEGHRHLRGEGVTGADALRRPVSDTPTLWEQAAAALILAPLSGALLGPIFAPLQQETPVLRLIWPPIYLVILGLAAFRARRMAAAWPAFIPLLLRAALALASSLWSQAPEVTERRVLALRSEEHTSELQSREN